MTVVLTLPTRGDTCASGVAFQRTITMNTTTTTDSSTPETAAQPPADSSTTAVAAQLIGLLDQFESLVPGFQPHDAAEVHRVATAARFANELIQPTITAVS